MKLCGPWQRRKCMTPAIAIQRAEPPFLPIKSMSKCDISPLPRFYSAKPVMVSIGLLIYTYC
jgi:hypothetical protein